MSKCVSSRARWRLPLRVAVPGALLLLLPLTARATVPGQNGRIAFQTTAGGPASIAVVNADGAGFRTLSFSGGQAGNPAWSPDGTKIAFVGGTASAIHLQVMDFFTGVATPLTSGAGQTDTNPAWSPDGTKVAFTRCGGSPVDCDVWVVNSGGGAPANLTQNPAGDDQMPAWSPDGTKIAFSTTRDGNAEIYTMNADGTGPVRLTTTPEEDLSPDWSPDGTHLVFARHDAQGNSEVWSMMADGTGPVDLGPGDQPVFSPDGARIAFIRVTDSNRDLWTMGADGSSSASLFASAGAESFPSWQPLNPGENAPPTADAGLDATFTCDSAQTAAKLDGSASTDPDSTPGTNDDIRLFEWWLDFGLPTEKFLGTGPQKDQLGLASGTYTITLQVTDSKGQTDTDEVVVTINDQTPPQMTVALQPARIWPPNHRMVRVHANVQATDFCGPATFVLLSVTSDEPENSTGDGNTAPDIQGVSSGTDDVAFSVRAERSGNGDGRVYTATYQATDPSGNTTNGTGEILVPHDQGHGNGHGSDQGNNGNPGPPPGKGKNKGKGKGNGHGNGNGNGNH